jgi:hypothetical protein
MNHLNPRSFIIPDAGFVLDPDRPKNVYQFARQNHCERCVVHSACVGSAKPFQVLWMWYLGQALSVARICAIPSERLPVEI